MSVMEKRNGSRSRRSFPEEFKTDAVSMVLDDGRRIVDVAGAIGVGRARLVTGSGWTRSSVGNALGLTRDDRAELAEVRKENARLRLERDY